MKKLYWVIIAIVVIILLAESYALYKIPQTHFVNGEVVYLQQGEIEAGTTFRVSLESRAQGESNFSIVSASETNILTDFPLTFRLPVLKKLLRATGIYHLRVEIFKGKEKLYANRELLPLTRTELNKDLTIELQLQPKMKQERAVKAEPEVLLEEIVEAVAVEKVAPIKLDISALLANKKWLLNSTTKNRPHLTFDISKKRVFGSGGCNDFQGGYLIDQTVLQIQYLISTEKNCPIGMKVEDDFLAALAEVKEWVVLGGKLYLYDKNRAQLLEFVRQ